MDRSKNPERNPSVYATQFWQAPRQFNEERQPGTTGNPTGKKIWTSTHLPHTRKNNSIETQQSPKTMKFLNKKYCVTSCSGKIF